MHQFVVWARRFEKTCIGRFFIAFAVVLYRALGPRFWRRRQRDLPERLRKTGGL